MLACRISDMPEAIASSFYSNFLLKRLGADELRGLRPHFESVELAAGDVLHAANTAIEYVYFIESGLTSMARPIESGIAVEIGLIGLEGMIGVPLALMADRTPFAFRVVLPGSAQRMHAKAFREALGRGRLCETMLLYVQAMNVQLAESAACNAKQPLDARVARWLLMCQDRIGRDEIDVTHAMIATNLAVRRAGVTDALHVLEGNRAIRSLRGRIIVLDRERLAQDANGSYGLAEAEYRRLLLDKASETVVS